MFISKILHKWMILIIYRSMGYVPLSCLIAGGYLGLSSFPSERRFHWEDFSPFSKIISHYYSNPPKKGKVCYSAYLVGISNFYLFAGFSMFFPQHILVLPVVLWSIPPPLPRRSLDRRSSARSPYDQRNPMGETRLTFVETRYES